MHTHASTRGFCIWTRHFICAQQMHTQKHNIIGRALRVAEVLFVKHLLSVLFYFFEKLCNINNS